MPRRLGHVGKMGTSCGRKTRPAASASNARRARPEGRFNASRLADVTRCLLLCWRGTGMYRGVRPMARGRCAFGVAGAAGQTRR